MIKRLLKVVLLFELLIKLLARIAILTPKCFREGIIRSWSQLQRATQKFARIVSCSRSIDHQRVTLWFAYCLWKWESSAKLWGETLPRALEITWNWPMAIQSQNFARATPSLGSSELKNSSSEITEMTEIPEPQQEWKKFQKELRAAGFEPARFPTADRYRALSGILNTAP